MKTISLDSRHKTLTVLKAGTNQPRHRPASLVLLIAAVRAASTQPHGQHFLFRKCQTVSYFYSIIKSGGFVGIAFTNKLRADEIWRRCFYRPAQNLLSTSPIRFQIKHWNTVNKFIILPFVLYGRKTYV